MRALPALLLVSALVPAAARASTADLTSEGGEPVLMEKERSLDIAVNGVLAQVTERARIVSQRNGNFEAVYRFALPSEAAVVDLSVKLPGGRVAKGLLVGADAAAAGVDDPDALKARPDVALLRRIEWDEDENDTEGLSRYELRVYPVDTKGIEARIRWLTPMKYADGRLSLRVPGRGTAHSFADAEVALDVTAPAGAGGLLEVVGSGNKLAKNVGPSKGHYKFESPAGRDVTIEAVPWFGEQQLWTSYATAPIDDTSGVLLVAALATPAKPSQVPHFDRVLFLIDVSRSMGSNGLVAARDLSDKMLETLGRQIKVEAVLYDRSARRVFSKWVENNRDTRQKLAAALAITQPANGSDLGAALDMVGPVLADARRKRDDEEVKGLGPNTLLVVLSDAVTPLALDGERALDHLGDEAAEQVHVVGITIYPEDGETPDAVTTSVGAFAARAGGRALVVRDLDAGGAAKQLAGELSKPTPLTEPTIDVGTAYLDGGRLPTSLEPGQGVVLIARYRGVLPKDLSIDAYHAADAVSVKLSAGSELAKAVLPLWAARARVEDFVPPAQAGAAPQEDDDSDEHSNVWGHAKRRFLTVAEQAHVVTGLSSMVALDPDDSFGRDRISYVEKWGAALFQRLPPPPEREAGHAIHAEHPDAGAPEGEPEVEALPTSLRLSRTFAVGTLDKGIIRRLVRTYVVPKARACYNTALRGNEALTGSLEIVLELSRGEVAAARVEKSTFSEPDIDRCVVDAAYTIDVPLVAGAGSEPISVVRYPLIFVLEGKTGEVKDDGTAPPREEPDPNDPLGGM